jgi:hypothetical protein
MTTCHIGNLATDPAIKYSTNGTPWLNGTIIEDSDEKLVLQFTIYGALAENFARSVKRGERIMICGDLVTQEFEQDGIKRSVTVIKPVKDVGASMLFGTTTFTRGTRP